MIEAVGTLVIVIAPLALVMIRIGTTRRPDALVDVALVSRNGAAVLVPDVV